MTTRLVLLGTAGGPTPQGQRFAPAQAVVVDGAAYLIDAGNGVAQQLARAGIAFSAIRSVLITHHHSDHNADVGNILLLGWSQFSEAVPIIGPPPLDRILDRFFNMQAYDIDIRVTDGGRTHLRSFVKSEEISAGGVVFEDDSVRVTAALVDHPPVRPAFAYRIDTADRSIVVSGDTRPCDALVELARGADVLVHEVMHVPAIGQMESWHRGTRLRQHLLDSHTRSDEVGEIAQRAGVPVLVLSHFTPSGAQVDDHTWAAEAQRGYDGTVVVGRDLMEV